MKISIPSSSSSMLLPPLSTYIRRTYNRHRHRQTLRYLKYFYDSFFTLLAGMDPTTATAAPPPPPPQSQFQSDGTSNFDSPPFNPKEPAIPISYPIHTLEELESRSYFDSFHFPFNKSTVKLQSGESDGASLPQRPRILVCHDMAGGYTDDKWVQGGNNPNAYAIWHWYLMDVFVYFSHSLVTLPPPCWINIAHKHGVKVLGTFIMEWDAGRIMANKLLSTTETVHMYAERLAELALTLGFDGWLLNMEVNLDVGQIPNLKEFVNHLSQTMHSLVSGSLVIWYDSVTVDGSLSWQNQLNEKNKPFFDLCDGIFVNYTWEESYPKDSAIVAGNRKLDVYMGVDVFGRNTYGGGQWTADVALDLMKKDDVSAAIFAPGWVYETKQPPNFEAAQNRWWGLVEKSWGISQKYPNTLPFYTNFDQGHGYHISVAGAQVSNAPWNNISSQSFQPFLNYTANSAVDTIQASIGFDELSYGGGGNITFEGTLNGNAYFTSRLFVGELVLEDKPLHFIYSVKSNGNSLLGLSLIFSSTNKGKRTVLLASHGNSLLTMNRFSSHYNAVIMPHSITNLEQAPGWILQESSINMSGYILTEIRAVCYIAKPAADVLQSQYHAVLGHLQVKTSSENQDFPPSTSWVVEGQYIKWGTGPDGSKKLSMKLSWKLKDGDNSSSVFPSYNIYVQKIGGALEDVAEYIGVAKVEAYYFSDIALPSATSSLKFLIQVCNAVGDIQKLEDAPFFELQVQDASSNVCIFNSQKPTKWILYEDGRGFRTRGSPKCREGFIEKTYCRLEAALKLIVEGMGHLKLVISCCMGLLCMCYFLVLLLKDVNQAF